MRAVRVQQRRAALEATHPNMLRVKAELFPERPIQPGPAQHPRARSPYQLSRALLDINTRLRNVRAKRERSDLCSGNAHLPSEDRSRSFGLAGISKRVASRMLL
ncbi:hypothetical protein [Rhodoligotrophos appendicifer]|uniref:hypothetical protein n=1 Tax=Rhodoligotrophos appendicifer TaxID=987056 RepID=UPI00195F2A84|nr:hypothetical protein [Rhodoligotrophos appendicifer]